MRNKLGHLPLQLQELAVQGKTAAYQSKKGRPQALTLAYIEPGERGNYRSVGKGRTIK